jgi:nitrogen fixation NifU-like protein
MGIFMEEVRELLTKSGYTNRAIKYYLNKINIGQIEKPTVQFAYTGPCGDTMKIYLNIESNIVKDAKFQAVGCAGTFSAGSALMEIAKNKNLEEVKKITEKDILNHLGSMPQQKNHCICLAITTFQKAIEKYEKIKNRARK